MNKPVEFDDGTPNGQESKQTAWIADIRHISTSWQNILCCDSNPAHQERVSSRLGYQWAIVKSQSVFVCVTKARRLNGIRRRDILVSPI